MRVVVLAIAMTTLTLGPISRPMHGQVPADSALALRTIHMVDAQTGWAILDDGGLLLRTTDGGIRWADVTPLTASGQPIRVGRITVLSSLIAWVSRAGASGSTTEVFRTFDGRTWRSATIPALGVQSISFINSREGWLIAGLGAFAGKNEVEIYHSTDGGGSWIKIASAKLSDDSSGLPIGGSKTAITFLNPETGWITGIQLPPGGFLLYVTHDGGRTWRQQNVPLPRDLPPQWRGFPQPPIFFTARDGILPVLYDVFDNALTLTGRVVAFYTTRDGGTTWMHTTPVRVNVTDQAYHAIADIDHAWVLNGGILLATGDRGERWTTMARNPLLADVTQLDFISPQVGWAVRSWFLITGGAPTFPFLLKSVDGGRTWAPVTYTISR